MSAAAFNAPSTPLLRAGLAQAVARVRLRRGLRSGATGLLAGAGVAAFLLALLRFHVWAWLDSVPDTAYLALPLAGVFAGAAAGAARRVDGLAVLRQVEETLHLKDRLSTARALASGAASPFAARQIADAEAAASDPALSFARAIPILPLPRRAWLALGVSALAFGLWLVPTLPYFQSPTQKAEQAQVQKEGERLVRIARALEKTADAKKLSGAKKTAARIAALGAEMQKGKMTRQQSLMKAAKLTEAVKQEQKEAALRAAKDNAAKSLPLAARELAQTLDPADPKGQTLRETAEALSRDDAASAAKNLSKLAEETQKRAPGDKASEEKRAKQLDKLSQSLQGTKLEKAASKIKEAADAQRRGDSKAASEKLREASQEAAKAGENDDVRAMEQAANALSEGKSGEPGEDSTSESQKAAGGESGKDSEGLSEGAGKNDAFNQDGTMKSGGEAGKNAKSGAGKAGAGKGTGNGIGSGAGKPGGTKTPVAPAGPYDDANNAPAGNKSLHRKTAKTPISDADFQRLYVPGGKMPPTRVTGKRGAKGKEAVGFYRGAPDKGSAAAPYYDVTNQYAPAAESALHRDDIPAAYKKQVRDYFDGIRPGTSGKNSGDKGK